MGTAAEASPPRHLQTILPSNVKSIKKAIYRPSQPVLEEIDPASTKYRTRTVHFWRSSEPLPESILCDSDLEEEQKHEAERQALEKCAASGVEKCSLSNVSIVKNGQLACLDIPGCQGPDHYAGCVAEAIVLGEK